MDYSQVKRLVKEYNLKESTVYSRIRAGWTEENFKSGYKTNRKRGGDRGSVVYNRYHHIKCVCKRHNMPDSPILESCESFGEFLDSIGWVPGMFFRIKDYSKPFSKDNILINERPEREKPIVAMSEKYNLPYHTAKTRLLRGWTEEDFIRGHRDRGVWRGGRPRGPLKTFFGYTVFQLMEKFNISKRGTVYSRIRNGWTLEDFEYGGKKRGRIRTKDIYCKKWWSVRSYCRKKGITLCDEWGRDFESFKAFLISIGWKEGVMIYPRSFEEPFGPDNYSFSRVAKKKAFFNMSAGEVMKKYNISRQVLSDRLKRGWTIEDFERGYKKKQKVVVLSVRDVRVGEMAEKYHLNYFCAYERLKNGWTEEDFIRGYRIKTPKKYFGFTMKELSEKYNISIGTVRSRLLSYHWTLEDFEKGKKK